MCDIYKQQEGDIYKRILCMVFKPQCFHLKCQDMYTTLPGKQTCIC